MPGSNKNFGAAAFFLLFVSGLCGLLYQVVWLRLAFASFGVITPVLSLVVSVFMAGLYAGTWAAGRWIAPLSRAGGISALYFYALAEGLIALGAWAVPRLFKLGEAALLKSGTSDSGAYLLGSALVICAALAPWCFAMGATLPCMMAAFRERTSASSRHSFSLLYLANTLGAVAGVLLSALVMIEALGLSRSLGVAALLNLGVALGALALARLFPAGPPAAQPAPARDAAPASFSATLFLTGFCSMGLEVAWARAFTPVLGTAVYAFALILFAFLLASSLGSWLYRRHLAAGGLHSRGAVAGALALGALLPLLLGDPGLKFGPLPVLLSIAPFCFVLGYLTPQLIDSGSGGEPAAAGRLYAWNILGSCLGPLAASYLLLPGLGLKGALLALALPLLPLLPASPRVWSARAKAGLALGGLALAGLLALARTHEVPLWVARMGRVELRRDHSATVISAGQGMDKILLVNGMGMTGLVTVTKVMAHLPMAHVKDPASSLAICFGMGTTLRSLSSWGRQATAVELVPGVREAFGYYFADAGEVLARPGVEVVVDDGRRYLSRSQRRFDVVTVDPPPPVEAAASSLLYSEEFYGLIKTRLNPGGVLQQWIPRCEAATARAAARSLANSFKHVRAYMSHQGLGIHFLASQEPLPQLDAAALLKRLPEAARRDLMEWEPGPALDFLIKALSLPVDLEAELSATPLGITDNRPFNEYYLLRRHFPSLIPEFN